MSRTIEMRLGYLIGFLRRQRLNAGDCSYKQENFIKCDADHPFDGIALGRKVCSLTTLSRLENGKLQNSYALMDFFLSKLGIRYRIKESQLELESRLLNRITSGFASLPQAQLMHHIETLSEFYLEHKDDILSLFNLQVVSFTKGVILNQNLQRQSYDALMVKFDLYPTLLQQWLLDCGAYLKQSHPDFWDLSITQMRFQTQRIHQLYQIMYRYGEPESWIILKTLIPNLNEESLVINKLKEQVSQIKASPENVLFISELRLCLLLAQEIDLTQEGTSALFVALKHFRDTSDSQEKLFLFETVLIGLLKHEPQPRTISKALSRRVLSLCKRAKSYKPLTKLVDLLNENMVEMS